MKNQDDGAADGVRNTSVDMRPAARTPEPTPTLADSTAVLAAAHRDLERAEAALVAATKAYKSAGTLDNANAAVAAERAVKGARERLRDAQQRHARRTLVAPVSGRGIIDERAMRDAHASATATLTVAPGAWLELDGVLYHAGEVVDPALLNWQVIEQLTTKHILIVVPEHELQARKRQRHHTHVCVSAITSARGILSPGHPLGAADVGGDKQLADLERRGLVRALEAEDTEPPSAA
jgi:hypothetical protein